MVCSVNLFNFFIALNVNVLLPISLDCATLQSAVEATVDLHCKSVCFNQLFGDVNIIYLVVLSKKDNFLNVSLFLFF